MSVIPSDDFAAYRQLLKGAYAEADRAKILARQAFAWRAYFHNTTIYTLPSIKTRKASIRLQMST